jgi:PleD family two-component response regulator
MSLRALVIGEPATRRQALARGLDAAFDLDIEQESDGLAAVRSLPARRVDLFVILADSGNLTGLDLVRFIREHAVHGRTPVLFMGGTPAVIAETESLGATCLPDGSSLELVRQRVQELLGLG